MENITTETNDKPAKSCLGCGGHSAAEYVWHDGLYQSYVCAEHARDQLPKRGRDDLRARKLENGGRERVVSGYATPIDNPNEKLVWEGEVEISKSDQNSD
jgi:hypothetical protein